MSHTSKAQPKVPVDDPKISGRMHILTTCTIPWILDHLLNALGHILLLDNKTWSAIQTEHSQFKRWFLIYQGACTRYVFVRNTKSNRVTP